MRRCWRPFLERRDHDGLPRAFHDGFQLVLTEHLGTLETVCRYPVKSMAGEEIKEAFVGYSGMMGDRVYSFVRPDGPKGFPWHTGREQKNLLLFHPHFHEAEVVAVPVDRIFKMAPGVNPVLPGAASRVGIDRLHGVLDPSPAAQDLMRRYVEALFTQALPTVACNALHSVEARCCSWVLRIHDRMSQDTLPLTHEFLAEMLGVQRSTVSLVTRTLQNAGLITQRGSALTVTDRPGLGDAACECHDILRRRFERLLPNTYETRVNFSRP